MSSFLQDLGCADNGNNVVLLNSSRRAGSALKHSSRDLKDPIRQLEIFRHVSRVWRAELRPAELAVFLFIVDQTVGWGREDYHFTYRELENGNPVTAGTGFSRPALRRWVKSLTEKGLILVDGDKSTGLNIRVNLKWEGSDVLPTPKRLQQTLAERVDDLGEGGLRNEPTPGSLSSPH